MTDKPWHAPLYGGMSEESARRSYEASLLRASPDPEWVPANPFDPDDFARRKVEVEALLTDYADVTRAACAWGADWLQRQQQNRQQSQPKGFKAMTRGEAVE
jgi:hypothetical protein